MQIEIKDCNNIDSAIINIDESRLNIKYALNGTGKSTVAKALTAFIQNDDKLKEGLKPFKFRTNKEHAPLLSGLGSNYSTVMCFNEEYVDQYTFQQDELVKNSFEIFIKNQKYEEHITAIETLVSDIRNFFRDNTDVDVLQKVMSEFINGYKATKTGFSAAGVLGKGLAKGNKLEHIPQELEVYEPYLHHAQSIKWLNWQFTGKEFLDVSNCCPYCTNGEIETKKETILKLGKEYDAKYIEHLNSMLEIFEKLSVYFSEETYVKIKELAKSATQLSPEQAGFLAEISSQIETFSKKLQSLKNLGFNSFKNVENIMNELGKYKIDMQYLSHLKATQTQEKVNHINEAINSLVTKAGKLQGEIAQQKTTYSKKYKRIPRRDKSFFGICWVQLLCIYRR